MTEETQKFLTFIQKVNALPKGEQLFISCPFSRDARNLRRKFYRLREELTGYSRELADRVSFKVEGHRLVAFVPADWSLNLGVSTSASSNQGGVSPRTRLDDSGRKQGV